MLESALEAGLAAAGLSASFTGPMPTPAVAYLTRTFRAEAGIVISASHNPYYDNGIKFFSIDGAKLPDHVEEAIEAEMEKPLTCVESAELGKASRIIDAAGRYIEFCKGTFPSELSLKGLKIVVDCANGATYHIAPSVLRELGANVIAIGCEPDGMLPICLGEATKFSQFLLDSDKRYRVIARLGQRTDTSDADGQIVQERPVNITQQQLDAALETFRGDIQQVPSMYSALKYQGKKLYEYARQGIEVPREARSITVYELKFIRWEGDELELEVHCSKGTYIRTITDDLGELLGCGAHVIYLRRLQVAKYPIERMVTLEQLNALLEQAQAEGVAPGELLDPLLMPMDSPCADFPEVNLLPAVAGYVKQGQPVQAAGAPDSGMAVSAIGIFSYVQLGVAPKIMPGRLTSPTVLAESIVGISEARMLSRISAADANFGEAPRLSISWIFCCSLLKRCPRLL